MTSTILTTLPKTNKMANINFSPKFQAKFLSAHNVWIILFRYWKGFMLSVNSGCYGHRQDDRIIGSRCMRTLAMSLHLKLSRFSCLFYVRKFYMFKGKISPMVVNMGEEGLTLEKVVEVFEKSWDELTDEYFEERELPIWCSESDVQLHLAHKLLNKLPKGCVHIELPVPLEVENFAWYLCETGRVGARKCIIPDIVILNLDTLLPKLIAEIKFAPVPYGFGPIEKALEFKKEKKETKYVSWIKNELEKTVNNLKSCQESGPPEGELREYTKNVDKLIGILKGFKSEEEEVVAGYLCVLDEYYPDIEERLKREIEKYNPPGQFKLMVEYHPMREELENALTKLQALT